MLIVMTAQATSADIERVCKKIESLGFRPHVMPGAQKTAIGITGNPGPVDEAEFEDLTGVAEAIRVSKPYKLVSREVKSENSIVYIKGVPVGGDRTGVLRRARVRSKAASRFLNRRASSKPREPNCCAAAPTSRELRPTRFKDSPKRD